jgi:hypothetical protein
MSAVGTRNEHGFLAVRYWGAPEVPHSRKKPSKIFISPIGSLGADEKDSPSAFAAETRLRSDHGCQIHSAYEIYELRDGEAL